MSTPQTKHGEGTEIYHKTGNRYPLLFPLVSFENQYLECTMTEKQYLNLLGQATATAIKAKFTYEHLQSQSPNWDQKLGEIHARLPGIQASIETLAGYPDKASKEFLSELSATRRLLEQQSKMIKSEIESEIIKQRNQVANIEKHLESKVKAPLEKLLTKTTYDFQLVHQSIAETQQSLEQCCHFIDCCFNKTEEAQAAILPLSEMLRPMELPKECKDTIQSIESLTKKLAHLNETLTLTPSFTTNQSQSESLETALTGLNIQTENIRPRLHL